MSDSPPNRPFDRRLAAAAAGPAAAPGGRPTGMAGAAGAMLAGLMLAACVTPGGNSIQPCPAEADEQAASDPSAAPRPGVVPPRPADPEAAVALVREHYPDDARAARLGGTVVMLVHVDAHGRVTDTEIQQATGLALLDDAAVAVVEAIEFRPGRRGDCTVPVWVRMPVEFDPGG